MNEKRFDDPVVVAVAKKLCYGNNVGAAEMWWPKLPFTQKNNYLSIARDVVELVESMQKRPRARWRNS